MVDIPLGGKEAGPDERLRLKVRVAGVVQGVGFRPFVYRLARREDLGGYILNDPEGVEIEVEGRVQAAERFLGALVGEKPPLARIDSVSVRFVETLGENDFTIRESENLAERTTLISPDVATCPDCLRELNCPDDRRHGYPFINCTNCGPRYTIIRDIPYDRRYTSMERFKMCPECQREYTDPLDRRFHAEPNACWVCGPQVMLRDASGRALESDDPIKAAADGLARGLVVAVKGLGGFHLAVDAGNDAAVRLLRERKRREEKPLAIMARDVAAARQFVEIDANEEKMLAGHQRPIVLLRKKSPSAIAESVAPGNQYLGVMLPYAPLHVLLIAGDFPALVMTSGNLSEEPIAVDAADAARRLTGIPDLYLDHDRDIVSRCDDSVVRSVDGEMAFLRRSRGWAPLPLDLDVSPPSILACGAHLKNTVAVSRRNQVFLSQHVGDLENVAAYEFFTRTIDHLKQIVEVRPDTVAYDLHPDYLSTRYALASGAGRTIGVQHHHAHIASCLGEARLEGPVIGLALDGTGYGPDGTVWGGEVLVATRRTYTRVGHLERVRIPGGEAAIKHIWRMALSHLEAAFGPDVENLPLESLLGVERGQIRVVLGMLRSGFNSPMTSSCGRLFDAVACLAGVRSQVRHEGQAAMELEAAAADGVEASYPVEIGREGDTLIIKVGGMVRGVVADVLAGREGGGIQAGPVSTTFHNWLAASLLETACLLRASGGIATVALSGGCFQNLRLLTDLTRRLRGAGFDVITNRQVPANDGGISYGQTVVAAAVLGET
jgi:hydrogenase maturation protein HypF